MTIGGKKHHYKQSFSSSSSSVSPPWYACVNLLPVISFGEDPKDYCLLSERPKHVEASIKHKRSESLVPEEKQHEEGSVKLKKQGFKLSAYGSANDVRCFDIEKEMFDRSSPRGVIEACLQGVELDPDFSETSPEEGKTHCTGSKAHINWSKFFSSWKKRSLKRLVSLAPAPIPRPLKGFSRSTKEGPALRDLYGAESPIKTFSFFELKSATNNFCEENLIGKGGFADVYKGCFPDGKLVAIKKMNKGNSEEKISGFLSEVGVIAHVDHPNIAKLLGCGIEGGMHLIFELSSLGNLASVLHGSEFKLDWSKRYKIALGIADGLLYLHETCQKRIIHRDIKAENILLTEDFVPQICDFGLAKWLPRQLTYHRVSKFEGTFGYFAPEYFMNGIVDEKTDIFAFGVLLLELITGRPALDDSQQSLVLLAKPLLETNNVVELFDPSLGDNYDPEEMEHMILTATLCVEHSPVLRPRMNQVVILLKGDKYVQECSAVCQKRSLQRTYSEELLDGKEYNKTRHLKNEINKFNKLKEIALA